MLTCVRWYVAYPSSLRHLEEMMAERGISVDHSNAHRRAIMLLPVLDKAPLLREAIDRNGIPETVTIDKSGANLAGLNAVIAERETPIKIRQAKYLNQIVEQDYRAIKRIVRPMLGFKDFHCARIILRGIEFMHMIAKGEMQDDAVPERSVAEQFYDLAM